MNELKRVAARVEGAEGSWSYGCITSQLTIYHEYEQLGAIGDDHTDVVLIVIEGLNIS